MCRNAVNYPSHPTVPWDSGTFHGLRQNCLKVGMTLGVCVGLTESNDYPTVFTTHTQEQFK